MAAMSPTTATNAMPRTKAVNRSVTEYPLVARFGRAAEPHQRSRSQMTGDYWKGSLLAIHKFKRVDSRAVSVPVCHIGVSRGLLLLPLPLGEGWGEGLAMGVCRVRPHPNPLPGGEGAST